MKSLNIGILAHVDAGKTSLTERLLFESGVIQTLGSVDAGNTQTDSMALERQRGITIRSAVVSFTVGNLKINLIDTPGHPDFIAEVERALGVLDAAILIISAVEGVQSQTRILMRTLKKLHTPTLIFINKVDRMSARSDELIAEIRAELFPNVVTMNAVMDIGTHDAKVTNVARNSAKLAAQINRMEVCPVFYGSAVTGAGVPELIGALETCLLPHANSSNDLLSAVVFKIERNSRDEKIAYVRVYTGAVHVRSHVDVLRRDENDVEVTQTAQITSMQLFKDGKVVYVQVANAGDIVKVFGLRDSYVNDWIGRRTKEMAAQFARPSLEVVVAPEEPADRPKLFKALKRMSEQDPLIQIHQSESGVLSIRLYGEVQREIIQALLHDDHNLDAQFEKTHTIYIEKVRGEGSAFADRHDPDNSFEATIGLKIGPGKPDSGIVFKIGVGRGSLPVAFQKAIEDTVHTTLKQGLYGWEVTDCVIEITHAGYDSVLSNGGDFRKLTPLLLMAALQKAETDVYEPLNRFELDVPESALPQVLQGLAKAEAKLEHAPTTQGGISHVRGTMPVRNTFDFERTVPKITHGEGVLTAEPGGYEKVHGTLPSRERTDANPLNRQEYLRHVLRRE